jgi:tRNA modification GTPase
LSFSSFPVNPHRMSAPPIIALQLTARAPGAIAVILLAAPSGADALVGIPPDPPDALVGIPRLLQRIARSPRAVTLPVGGLTKTALRSPEGTVLDDALVVRTAEDRWELHLHGGTAVVDGVLAALRQAGVRILPPEDAPELLAPGLEGELQLALPHAVTETALRLLLAQPRAWRDFATHWQGFLQQPRAAENLWQLHSAAQWLLYRSRSLRHLLEPARVAIIGPPNAGKSTLANALLGRPVSITSATAGTTRDWVDAHAIFATPSASDSTPVQAPVILVDTAGVRDTHDALEQTSIARTHHQAAAADVVILLFDATREPSPRDLSLLEAYRDRPLVPAANKIDALPGPLPPAYASLRALPLSAKTHQNLDALMTAVLAQLDLHSVGNECFAFTSRQRMKLIELSTCDNSAACAALLDQLSGAMLLTP